MCQSPMVRLQSCSQVFSFINTNPSSVWRQLNLITCDICMASPAFYRCSFMSSFLHAEKKNGSLSLGIKSLHFYIIYLINKVDSCAVQGRLYAMKTTDMSSIKMLFFQSIEPQELGAITFVFTDDGLFRLSQPLVMVFSFIYYTSSAQNQPSLCLSHNRSLFLSNDSSLMLSH